MFKNISICLCTYNGEQFIAEQLQSILSQTYPISEIIIVDDKSTDSTIEAIKKFKNSSIKLYQNSENLGYIKNFEKAISLSSGELIVLSDQGDIWYPNKIKMLVENIGKNSLIYHNSEYVDRQGNNLNRNLFDHKKYLSGQKPLAFIYGSCVTGHTMMFKRDLKKNILPFPEKYPHDWWIGYVASAEKGILYLDQILTKYRHHENNVIAGKDKLSKEAKSRKVAGENFERLEILKNYKNLSKIKKLILDDVYDGLKEKKGRFFSFKLFKTLFKNRDEILALNRGKFLSKFFFMVKESYGEKIKP